MKYRRHLLSKITAKLDSGKALLLIGPRRVGKTVLLKEIKANSQQAIMLLNGEDPATASLLYGKTVHQYKQLLGSTRILMIDEAQKLKNIGSIVKLMLDEIEGLTIVLTGSSSFDLNNKFGEPLTGRKISYHMFPISHAEFSQSESALTVESTLEDKLIYGTYPEVLKYEDPLDKSDYLIELANDYLFRDILMFDKIRNASKIQDIIQLLAFQVGKDVSSEGIGRSVGLARLTVDKYLDLLTKVFVIFPTRGFSRNLRKEITKMKRWYFIDNGILNTIRGDFRPLSQRNDVEMLWENYIISERLKTQHYTRMQVKNYFWRTYDQQEIDWVEARESNLFAYEIKWSKGQVKTPVAWEKAYPDAHFTVINRNNYRDFLEG